MEELEYEKKKQVVIDKITAAFNGVELGKGVSFHEAIVIDDYWISDRNHEVRREARAKDTEVRWQDVPDDLIRERGSGILNFLDARGLRYYLPAFLVWYLRYMDSQDMDFSSNTFASVDHQLHRVVGYRTSLARFSLFSPAQSQAVAHFLEFLIMREDKMEAEDEAERQVQVASEEMTEEQTQKRRQLSRQSNPERDYAEQSLKGWRQFSKMPPFGEQGQI